MAWRAAALRHTEQRPSPLVGLLPFAHSGSCAAEARLRGLCRSLNSRLVAKRPRVRREVGPRTAARRGHGLAARNRCPKRAALVARAHCRPDHHRRGRGTAGRGRTSVGGCLGPPVRARAGRRHPRRVRGRATHARAAGPVDCAGEPAAAADGRRHAGVRGSARPESALLVELVYFWALSASPQAVLTPDLAQPSPDVLFFSYFATHPAQ
jgi:hypothetical protein